MRKFKVGQRVTVTQRWVDWHSSHLVWSLGRRVEGEESKAYPGDGREIHEQDLHMAYALSRAKLGKKFPRGVVIGHGSPPCVKIRFTYNTELGKIVDETFAEPEDLVLIKKRKSRR